MSDSMLYTRAFQINYYIKADNNMLEFYNEVKYEEKIFFKSFN